MSKILPIVLALSSINALADDMIDEMRRADDEIDRRFDRAIDNSRRFTQDVIRDYESDQSQQLQQEQIRLQRLQLQQEQWEEINHNFHNFD